jgi:hypothetical protein
MVHKNSQIVPQEKNAYIFQHFYILFSKINCEKFSKFNMLTPWSKFTINTIIGRAVYMIKMFYLQYFMNRTLKKLYIFLGFLGLQKF